jgi:hypothetical protein
VHCCYYYKGGGLSEVEPRAAGAAALAAAADGADCLQASCMTMADIGMHHDSEYVQGCTDARDN